MGRFRLLPPFCQARLLTLLAFLHIAQVGSVSKRRNTCADAGRRTLDHLVAPTPVTVPQWDTAKNVSLPGTCEKFGSAMSWQGRYRVRYYTYSY